jgi:uncharacterized protein involved in outer membrane biogenesis
MSTTATATPPPAARRGWLKKLVFVAAALAVLLVVAFFVLTSSAFLKGFVLPRVGKAMNATVTADDVKLSPFSELHLRGLKVQTTGTEPLLTVNEARVRYRLMAILGGTLRVDEITVDTPVVTVVETADGKRNTDPLTEGPAAPPAPAKKTSAPPQVDLKNFQFKNATLRYVRHHPGGTRDLVEVTGLNVTLADVQNGAAGRFEFAMQGQAELNPPDATQRGSAAFTHDGKYTFTLGPDLFPTAVQGADKLDFTRATGTLAELAGAGLDFTADLTPTELKNLGVAFRKAGTPLGAVRVTGPFDAAKREGRLTLTLAGVDRRLLNLVGAPMGLDFGGTEISSTNTLELTAGGNALALAGQFNLERLQVTQAGRATPRLDLAASYAITVDTAKSTAQVRTLNLAGRQNDRPVLVSELNAPMTLSWGTGGASGGDATMTLTVNDLDLGAWRGFTEDAVAGGSLAATVKLLSQNSGKKLGFDAQARLADLSAGPATNRLTQLGVSLAANGSVRDLAQVTVERFTLNATYRGQQLAAASGKADYDLDKGSLAATADAQAWLVPLLGLSPGTLTNLTAGTMQVAVKAEHKPGAASVTGKLTLADLAGRSGREEIRLPATTFDFDVAQNGNQVEVRQGLLKLAATDRAKNELTLTGRADLTKADAISGQFKLAAEALDLTRYYDLFMGGPGTETAPPPASTEPEREPDALTLPLRNFVCQLQIDRLFLREVDVRDWRATLQLDGGRVVLSPFSLQLNGAPVTAKADLDLGVPGFKYAVEFNAPAVPLAPLVNSFQPERKGQLGGTANASAKLTGAGVTGANLQKNLAGQFDFATTNLSLSLGDARMPVLKSLINVVVGIPDAIRNPTAAVGNLMGRLLGAPRSSGGIVDEFFRSPINGIVARGTAGGGQIELREAFVESLAFRADAAGSIAIADVLTNSVMNFPVSVALGRSVSDKLGLTPSNHPTNAPFVPLPDFVKMKGTLGMPKPDVNYLVVAQLALRTGGGVIGNTGSALGSHVSGVAGAIGGLLGGQPATNAPATTNAAPATNAPAADLIRGLGGLLGGRRTATNPPATNAPPR